jgi:hypothetical protein
MNYLDLELEARVRAASAWMRLVSHSMRTLPRARSKAANPSSYAVMAPSLISSSLSQVRSCSYNSMVSVGRATPSEGEEALHQSTSRDQRMTRSKPRQSPAQSKTPLGRWRGSAGGAIRPCSTKWWLTTIVAGAPTPRMLAVISTASHHRQWSMGRASKSATRKGVSVPTR